MDTPKFLVKSSEREAATAIVKQYLSKHETGSYTYRPFVKKGIYRNSDYRYCADLKCLLSDAPLGSFSYLWAVYSAPGPTTLRFALIPFGPVKVYVNGVLQGYSDIFSERYHSKQIIELSMQKGENNLVLVCENTSGGFGCEFGTWVGKLDYYFMMPSRSAVQEGVCYSEAQENMLEDVDIQSLSSLVWFPEMPKLPKEELHLSLIFPQANPLSYAIVVTSLHLSKDHWVTFKCNAEVFVDGKPIQGSLELSKGEHQIKMLAKIGNPLFLSVCDAKRDTPLPVVNPVLPRDCGYRYLIAGPFECRPSDFPIQFVRPFSTLGGTDFWHLEESSTYLRIYNENPLFGHWNYPLGVTLYGLAEAQKMLVSSDPELASRIDSYLVRHVQSSIDTYAYALWDKATLGGATAVHHLMTSLDSLDDCGSFASTLLEIAQDHPISGYEELIDVVGTYISKTQPRLADGTFFRTALMHEFHENTLWADDLYMSVPFLCRYSAYRQDPRILEDAIGQFFGFSKYLYQEDTKLMSHVYDFNRNIATGIPWGRGNGWVLFSLSELLMVLEPAHPKREKLLSMFRNLSEGYLALQDEDGMFHQVLNMASSYQESSCTAMFACAFSRGFRHDWYHDPEPYRQACIKACDGLKKKAKIGRAHV